MHGEYQCPMRNFNRRLTFSEPRFLGPVWFAVVAAFAGIAAWPVSNTLTRLGGVVTLVAGWSLLAAMIWRRRLLRASLLTISVLCAAFVIICPRRHEDVESMRDGFVAGLLHYEGVSYVWGGECFTGIDCSGLVRRGLIDSLFLRGIRTLDGGLIRYAICLWWHDCTASDLGYGRNQLTIPVIETPSINTLNHSRLARGDLAVTRGGEHVMAYLGDDLWIEADPLAHRVITVRAPSRSNAWFNGPMRIVRWSILNQ
jgi:hypothetical protein